MLLDAAGHRLGLLPPWPGRRCRDNGVSCGRPARGPERWEMLALSAWAITVLVICGRTALAPQSHNVYLILASAARNWLAGADLYRPEPSVYRYSPVVAALLVPLGLLPEALGGVIWRLVNVA